MTKQMMEEIAKEEQYARERRHAASRHMLRNVARWYLVHYVERGMLGKILTMPIIASTPRDAADTLKDEIPGAMLVDDPIPTNDRMVGAMAAIRAANELGANYC